jgi:hypothetical protein
MFLVHLQVLEEPVFIRLAERSHSRSPHHSEEDEEDASDKEEDSEEDDSEEDDSWETLCQDTITPHEPIRPPSGDDPDPPTLGEVLLTVLDWYSSHKQTYTATEDLYKVLELVVPKGTTVGTFKQLRAVLDTHRLETCQMYDACPKGCMVYHNFTGVMQSHQYGDLDQCPYCESPRYVGMGSLHRAAHVVYFFPIARFLKDLFSRADLCPYLDNRPSPTTPESSIKLSRGYRDKVLNNVSLRGDHRNQGLVLSTDGIPYFGAAAKHSRGAWPVLGRLASLPDGLWDRFEFAHLWGLEAQEHWETDIETGKVHRKRR